MAKKSSSDSSKKKKKSKNKIKNKLSILNSEAKKTKAPKENPFESIWSRRKFNILGKKRKDDERRRIGLSRSLAIQKRQKTLLKEYEQSTKSSVFVDKRIGEQDEGLAEFDKAILRSQRERQLKLTKKSKYNLSDGEEDDFEFPENGYFPERDDFEDELPLDEDEAGPSVGNERKLNLGQLDAHEDEDGPGSRAIEGQENSHKSKKEVMEDIITKSKFFKAQKAKDKEENEQFIEQLDKDFTYLAQTEALMSLTQPNKMKALDSLVNNGMTNVSTKKVELHVAQNKVSFQQEKADDYDKLVGELALEMRARPSDRTKAPEELAQEEKERLEELEEARQRRMVAAHDVSSGNEDANTSEDDDDGGGGESVKQIKHISGDDLGDSFSHDATPKTRAIWIDDIIRKETDNNPENEDVLSSGESENDDDDGGGGDEDDDDDDDDDDDEGSDEDHLEDEKAQSLKDWEQSDDEKIGTNLEEEEEEDDGDDDDDDDVDAVDDDGDGKQKDMIDMKSISRSKAGEGAYNTKTNVKEDLLQKVELPYTIDAPKNFEEFSALVENLSDDQIVEAIRRIRTFNAISIAAENRKKFQVFYGVLLQYFAVLANKKPLNFELLDMLLKPLIEMSTQVPYFAAICARERLLRTRTQFCENTKNTGKSGWPSLKTLFLLRLWSMIFPCSDFRHAVMTPAILLMCEYLMKCPVVSGRDIAVGSFLCSMVLSVSSQSQKFCPEAITFIQTMLMAALNNKQGYEASQLYRLMELKTLKPVLHMEGRVEEINSLDFLTIMDLPDDSPYFTSNNFRASILFAIIGNLKGFVKIYEGFKSFPEIFLPISKILYGLSEDDLMPDALKVEIKDTARVIENKSQEHHLLRRPLRIRKQKIIKTAIPKFEDNFVKGRDYDPDRDRAERKKLKKKLKQEARGAMTELRKDNYFLLEVKEKDKARMAEEKAEKLGKFRAFLQEQEHAFKSGQLGKGKGRKRRR
ncbi:hypothetical protein OROMI_010076 [Orobanche minor]